MAKRKGPSLPSPDSLVDPMEDRLWGPMRESFGLTLEQWQRLTKVVTLHMALDSLLFMRVALGLTVVAGGRANTQRINRRVNKMRFVTRLELAQDAGWISEELAEDIAAVNALRNRLLHFDFKRGADEAPEIASGEAFRAFTTRGLRAWLGWGCSSCRCSRARTTSHLGPAK
jgi:hypothetical protein